MIVAHEFFDALPIHQFEAADGAWFERLVGLTEAPPALDVPGQRPVAPAPELCFARAPTKTGTQRLVEALGHLSVDPPPSDGALVEVCIDAVRVCSEIRRRLSTELGGGSVLVVDYGDATISKETLRGFRSHKEVGVLDAPGTVSCLCESYSDACPSAYDVCVLCSGRWGVTLTVT
jgi:NADH dehydrogenase [ubiquinone] 1 alpha subcomplex assembly factor 7